MTERDRINQLAFSFDKGFEKGFKEGFEKGFKEEFEKSFKEEFEKSFKEGFEKGYKETGDSVSAKLRDKGFSPEEIAEFVEPSNISEIANLILEKKFKSGHGMTTGRGWIDELSSSYGKGFQEGYDKGLKEGFMKGFQQPLEEMMKKGYVEDVRAVQKKYARMLLECDMDISLIMECTGLSEDVVRSLKI